MKDELLNPMVGIEVEFPSIAWVVATIRWVFHHYPLAGTLTQRQFLHSLISDSRAVVPGNMEREEQPVLIIKEIRIDSVLHDIGLGAEL